MFGMTNSKELMLRARSLGVDVTDEFIATHQYQRSNDVADALEATYGIKVVGENVFPPEIWYVWADGQRPVKLQSTIQPQAFVTVPHGNHDLVNDLCESGLYRVWSS